ncbi:6590_t:CDS:2, partial [Rhizophagus irregularis]
YKETQRSDKEIKYMDVDKDGINAKAIKAIKEAKIKKWKSYVLDTLSNTHNIKRKMKKEFLLKKDLMFFQKLEDLNLWDVHKEEHDMDQTREICTFTGVSSMTRIDYIWCLDKDASHLGNSDVEDLASLYDDDDW